MSQEPEITPAMIEAGMIELVDFEWGWGDEEDAAVRVFRAMWAAMPKPPLDNDPANQ